MTRGRPRKWWWDDLDVFLRDWQDLTTRAGKWKEKMVYPAVGELRLVKQNIYKKLNLHGSLGKAFSLHKQSTKT